MNAAIPREASIEEELYHQIRNILDKNNSRLNGVHFGSIQPQHSVEGGIADLVLHFADGNHCLVIECKRKVGYGGSFRALKEFDVFGNNVLSQTLNYAMRLGARAFATTNGSRLALFRTPTPPEPFRIDTHRLLVIDPFNVDAKNVEKLILFLSKWVSGAPVRLVEIDWFFISRLRSFTDFLSNSYYPVLKQLAKNKEFENQLHSFSERIGGVGLEQLARETGYLLMNKIVFYKTLERYYPLSKLKSISAPDGEHFTKYLQGYFEKSIEITGDFEPIFVTEFYDKIPLPSADYVFDEINSFIDEMNVYRLEEIGTDVVGFIYEELIPAEERHRLGQFYTPPPIAELIVKWAIRTPNDKVLDPAIGSGTFAVKTYKRLYELKSAANTDPKEVHKEILAQIYGNDINPFPAHLTSLNLAMRNVKHPTSDMNIIVDDFFNLRANTEVFAPYIIRTPKGEMRRHISLPLFDAIVANPPYTRGNEINSKTKRAIDSSVGDLLKTYGLSGGLLQETGIYVHFILHSFKFLKRNGRLAMIISNSWLQTDYGIDFCNFLLDHFKVKAVVDFNQRLFRVPLVATCVLLLEREDRADERNKNTSVFLYVNQETNIDEVLDALQNPDGWSDKYIINKVEQKNLSRTKKWIREFFDLTQIEKTLFASPAVVEASEFFETRFANMSGVSARGGTGADKFFYLTNQQCERWNIPEQYRHPALVKSRNAKTFVFEKTDWQKLKSADKPCFAFICHQSRKALTDSVEAYIQWGETTPIVRVRADEEPKTAVQSMASISRANAPKQFFGWYDLGHVINASVFVSRRAQYHNRFVLSKVKDLAIDDGFITLIPKKEIPEQNLAAILASFNSEIGRFFIELYGRSTGGGAIELDDKTVGKVPIIDCRKIPNFMVKALSELFEELETKAQEIGQVETEDSFEKLQVIVDKINSLIAEAIQIDSGIVKKMTEIERFLYDRRVARKKSAAPETVKGEDKPIIKPPKKVKKMRQKSTSDKPLTKWLSRDQ